MGIAASIVSRFCQRFCGPTIVATITDDRPDELGPDELQHQACFKMVSARVRVSSRPCGCLFVSPALRGSGSRCAPTFEPSEPSSPQPLYPYPCFALTA